MWPPAYLVSCFAVTLGCGTMYAYSAYAPQLSDRLNLSASTISSIGMLGNFSMSLSGPFAGMIVDTQGFLIPVVTSILCIFSGYAIVLTSYEKTLPSVSLLSLALFLIGAGATCAFSASVKCAAVNFPHIRGTATAITMSGYGLSAFLMSAVSQLTSGSASANTGGGAAHMLSVLTVLPTLLMCVFGPIVIKGQHRASSHSRHVSSSMGGIGGGSGLNGGNLTSSRTGSARNSNSGTPHEEYVLDTFSPDLLIARISERQRSEREIYGLALLKTPTFWLYFFILGLLAGLGQAYIYTCGYMVKSLLGAQLLDNSPGGESSLKLDSNMLAPLQAHQVAILSVANCAGRVLSGTFSDTLKTQLRLPRIAAVSLAWTLCLAAMISAKRVSSVDYMWVPSVLVGLFYGAIFGAFPGIVSDSFGVKRLSSNWGVVALAQIPFSSYLAIRVGKYFDTNSSASGNCFGTKCFEGAYTLHLIIVAVVFVLLVQTCRLEWKKR